MIKISRLNANAMPFYIRDLMLGFWYPGHGVLGQYSIDIKGQLYYTQEYWGGSGRIRRVGRGSKNCSSEIHTELNSGRWYLQVGSLTVLKPTILISPSSIPGPFPLSILSTSTSNHNSPYLDPTLLSLVEVGISLWIWRAESVCLSPFLRAKKSQKWRKDGRNNSGRYSTPTAWQ